ncbi:hypothetical protein CB0940_04216 [Cercospora beticola]|uniref:Uncharacterized protein n=1 Tax=Cercospora beticola TaxID=122368 RepID=A0A2G5HM17_CERBT|nr:hypothetical protein CB0940_04216 [Cercospora beticola]PIA93604.1 hypothetical protein CB0940_04216 [Cercospora beticola]
MSSTRAYRPRYNVDLPPTKPRSSKDQRISYTPSSSSTPLPSRSNFNLPERPKKAEPPRKQYHYDNSRKSSPPSRQQEVSSKTPAVRSSRSTSDPTRSPRPRYLEVESGSSGRKQHRSQPRRTEERDASQVRFSPFVTVRTYK